jgi:Holliday junction resolvase-like predicted endonuclease
MNSRAKGKAGELEAAKALTAALECAVRRNAQYCGAAGDADLTVECLPQLHVEVKRRRNAITPDQAEEFLQQAERDALERALPFLIHRVDQDTRWCCTVRLDRLYDLVVMLAKHKGWRA